MEFQVNLTFEAPTEAEGQRILDAIAQEARAEIQTFRTSATSSGGMAILVSRDEFAATDTDAKPIRISKEDAEVCDKATTVLWHWWETAAQLALLPAEGDPEQLQAFPFQRLGLIAERHQEA